MDPRELLNYLLSTEGVVIFFIVVLLLISLLEPQYTLFNIIVMFLVVARYIRYREENNA